MIVRALVVALALLGGCPADDAADDGAPRDLSGFDAGAADRLRAECEEGGGTWGSGGGVAGALICYEATRDAGQSCRSGTECEGLCLARSGSCAPITPFLGCHEVLTDQGQRATLCID